jgi:hypothetical protein
MTHDTPMARLIVVIDDDPLVLEGMSGLLRSWGYQAVAAATDDAPLTVTTIICYRLSGGKSGVKRSRLRRSIFRPSFPVNGARATLRGAAARAHKPDSRP